MIFRRRNFALFVALFGSLVFSNIAAAKNPVIVEFFGKNACAADTVVQESLQDILQGETDVILINCRTRHDKPEEVRNFTHQFCTDRLKTYTGRLGTTTFHNRAVIVVNGRWDANINDIMPAINLARTDNVQPISLNVHDNMIDISIPEIESDMRSGEIILYTYVPTIDEEAVFVDADMVITDKIKEQIGKNFTVPFVTKARTSPLYLRPVLATEKVGRWNGKAMDFTFSLNDVTSLTGANYADLSYVVVLQEGDEFGGVLAVGEIISTEELHNTLPHSKPIDIKYVSQPMSGQAPQ